jgi:YD repeat-containing protein
MGARRFELDPAGRVTGVAAPTGAERYSYDLAGNVAMAGWPGEDPAVREFSGSLLRSAGRIRYQHDPQGRVVVRQKKRLSSKPDIWRYTWDSEDRLVAVTTPNGAHWRYRYDPLGRRIAKQRLGRDGTSVAEQVDFFWDGSTLAEQVHNGVVATTWDWEPGRVRPVGQTHRERDQQWFDKQFYSIVTDLVGTPTELIDEHGNLAWRQQTTLWGEALSRLANRASTPFRFPGQYFDDETGLHYNYHRHA